MTGTILYTSDFKAFIMFSMIGDLTGHSSIMFDEISQHMWFFMWNMLNNGVTFHDANSIYVHTICLLAHHHLNFYCLATSINSHHLLLCKISGNAKVCHETHTPSHHAITNKFEKCISVMRRSIDSLADTDAIKLPS